MRRKADSIIEGILGFCVETSRNADEPKECALEVGAEDRGNRRKRER